MINLGAGNTLLGDLPKTPVGPQRHNIVLGRHSGIVSKLQTPIVPEFGLFPPGVGGLGREFLQSGDWMVDKRAPLFRSRQRVRVGHDDDVVGEEKRTSMTTYFDV